VKSALLGVLAALLLGAMAVYSAGWMWAVRGRPTAFGGIVFEVLPRGTIRTVTPGSPAERAGLWAGDRVLTVNGRPLHTPTIYSETTYRGRPGESVLLGVERTGAPPFTLSFRLAALPSEPPAPLSRRVVQEILGSYPLPFLLVAAGVLLLRIDDPHAWRLALVFASFMAGAPIFEAALPPALRSFSVAYKVGFQGANPALFLFFSAFPTRSALDRRLAWLKWLCLIGGVGVSAFFAAWAFSAASLHPLREWVEPRGWVEPPVAVYVFGTYGLGLAHLAGNALRGAPEGRRKSRVIVWGTVAGTGPITLLFAAATYLRKPVYEFPFWVWAPCVIALSLTPLAFAYAVVRHRVLEIPVLLRRSARYLLVQRGSVGLLIALGVAAAMGFSLALGRAVGPQAEAAVAGLSVGFGTVLVWTGSQIHRQVRERIDRSFFRSAYDAKHILQDLAERARAANSREELAGLIEHHVRSALLPRTLAVYVESGGGLARVGGSEGPARLSSSLPFLCELARDGRPCEVSAGDQAPDALGSLTPECLVPLSGRDGSLLGLIALGPRLSEEPYSGEDQRLLASVASQAATALDSLRLAEQMAERLEVERRAAHEMELAKRVQSKLLPQSAPILATLECVGRCLQARAVGGDYYDFLELESGRLGLALADVAGKGFPAALLMASLQASLRSRALPDLLDLPRQLRAVSQLLYRTSDTNRFATLFLGIYDDSTRRLFYANCGHNPPVLLRAAGPRERLAPTGPALGLLEGWDGEAQDLLLAPGDLLAVFSDGITETFDARDEEFGEERLIALLSTHSGGGLDALADRVFETVRAFGGSGEQQDDQTLLLARVK